MKKNYTSGRDKGGSSYGGNRGGGGGRSGGNRGGRDGGQQAQMHPATCSGCKARTEVPFRPTGDKPVYCRDCFASQNNDRGGDRGGYNKSDRSNSGGFKKQSETSSGVSTQKLEKQLEGIYTKLDQILNALSNNGRATLQDKNSEVSVKKESKKPEIKKEDIKKAVEAALASKDEEPVKPAAKKATAKKKPAAKKKAAPKKKPAAKKKTAPKKK